MTKEDRDIIKITTGMDYDSLHRYLRKTYGNANFCSNPDCQTKNPKRFEWALIKGKKYSKIITDYIPLCCPCHRRYDFTETQRTKLKESMKGKRVGDKNPAARKIICQITGKEYLTVKDAAISLGIKRTTLIMMLKGHNKNKTTFKYA